MDLGSDGGQVAVTVRILGEGDGVDAIFHSGKHRFLAFGKLGQKQFEYLFAESGKEIIELKKNKINDFVKM